jgi:hypothetical protein
VKALGKARAASRDSGLQLEQVQAKVKTKSGTHPNLIAGAQAPGKVKEEKDPELERERTQVETNGGTYLNVMLKGQAVLENTATRSEPKIRETEMLEETKAKRTPEKWLEPEVVPLTGPIR